MSEEHGDTGSAPLQQEVRLQPRKRSSKFLASILLASIGGFVGGLITSYGPTYMNIYLTQPAMAEESEMQARTLSHVTPVSVEPPIEVAAGPQRESPPGAQARLVVHSGQRSYIVIRDNADSKWGIATKNVERNDYSSTSTQPVTLEKLPPKVLDWSGREVTLYSAEGYACSAIVSDLYLLQEVHAEEYEAPDGEWDSQSSLLLAARLLPLRGRCQRASWARDKSLPPPDIGRLSTPGAKLKMQARDAFRRTEAYKESQNHFEAEGQTGFWDESEEVELSIRYVQGPDDRLVVVTTLQLSCGGYGQSLGQVFERDAEGALHLVDSRDAFIFDIAAAADMDGDGDLDLVTRGDGADRSLILRDEWLREETRNQVAIYYCRC